MTDRFFNVKMGTSLILTRCRAPAALQNAFFNT